MLSRVSLVVGASASASRRSFASLATDALGRGRSVRINPLWAGACLLGGSGFGWACMTTSEANAAQKSGTSPLSPDEFRSFKLDTVTVISDNTKLFRFALNPSDALNMPVASCLVVRAPKVEQPGEYDVKAYTPINAKDTKGHFDLLVKSYAQGKVSKYFGQLKPGDMVDVKGPYGKLEYTANMKKKLGMIAGGTGITPMLQVIEEIFNNPADKTEVNLVYANVEFKDILLKSRLDALEKKFYPRFKVHYVLEKVPENWNGSTGYISKEVLQKHIPSHSSDSLVFICGPPAMMTAICGAKGPKGSQGEVGGLLKSLGFTEAGIFKF